MIVTDLFKKAKEDYFISFIYLYIFLMPWNFTNGQMGILSLILVIWWLVIGKYRGYFSKLKNLFNFKPLVLLILFIAYSYISLLWTTNYDAGFEALNFYKYYWIMIPVLFTSLSHEQAKNGFIIFILSIGSYALFSILIYLNLIHLTDNTTDPNSTDNPRGILAYAIITPYMAIGFLSSFAIAFYNKINKTKIIFYAVALLSFIALFINNGRAGQLAFFMTLVLLIILHRQYFIHLKFIVPVIIIFTASIYLLDSFNKLDRFKTGINELRNPEAINFSGSWGERIYMWYAAADIVPKHPIVGVGAGDNIDEFIEFTKTHPSDASWLRSFHNQHLDTLTRYGFTGYILLWGSVLWLLYCIKMNKLYFTLSVIFFSMTFFDGLGDIILLMKPYNNIFILVFLLTSVIAHDYIQKKEMI